MQDLLHIYNDIWAQVRNKYARGFCVSERGLQALLYAEFSQALPTVDVVVEPGWNAKNERYVPDFAIVDSNEVTDVFEIKFTPHTYAKFEKDISKLLRYGSVITECAIALDHRTGTSLKPASFSPQLRRHFVVIAKQGSDAVWTESILKKVPDLSNCRGSFVHWYGRTGSKGASDDDWSITVTA